MVHVLCIFKIMTVTEKFLSDIARIRKREWQTSGSCTYDSIRKELRRLFENSSLCPGELSGSVFEYWENTYSAQFDSNSSDSPVFDKLAGMLSFLNKDTEFEESLTQEDWNEIGKLTGYEAEDLPMDFLQELMSILVNHNAY